MDLGVVNSRKSLVKGMLLESLNQSTAVIHTPISAESERREFHLHDLVDKTNGFEKKDTTKYIGTKTRLTKSKDGTPLST
jgi:hypothetical protein